MRIDNVGNFNGKRINFCFNNSITMLFVQLLLINYVFSPAMHGLDKRADQISTVCTSPPSVKFIYTASVHFSYPRKANQPWNRLKPQNSR